jgi:Family of unknown function (DUF6527)
MKLTELDPHWVGLCRGHAIGVTFLCPCCRKTRIGIAFDEPIGGHHLENLIGRDVAVFLTREFREGTGRFQDSTLKKWHRIGETFQDLTLTPSIDTSEHGHWHGSITNGEMVGGSQIA